MAIGSEDRGIWDLDVRPLDGYAELENPASVETIEAATIVAKNKLHARDNPTAPGKTPNPVRPNPKSPSPKNPNREVPPATAYTPGVLSCVRGLPPRRNAPKGPR